MIDPGTELTLVYPALTHIRYAFECPRRERDIVIRGLRDLARQPLSTGEFLRRPFILRSRWLLRAVEAETGEFRQFYLGSADNFRGPGVLRIGLYEPGNPRPVEVLRRQFEANPYDRQVMVRLLRRWKPDEFSPLRIGISCDDLRVIGAT